MCLMKNAKTKEMARSQFSHTSMGWVIDWTKQGSLMSLQFVSWFKITCARKFHTMDDKCGKNYKCLYSDEEAWNQCNQLFTLSFKLCWSLFCRCFFRYHLCADKSGNLLCLVSVNFQTSAYLKVDNLGDPDNQQC